MAASYVLSNRFCAFTFSADPTYGLVLTSWQRLGGHLWTNVDGRIWGVKVWDSTAPNAASTAFNSPATVTVAQTGKTLLVATWPSLATLGGDTLTATMTASLDEEQDWLKITLSVRWVGVPTRCSADIVDALFLSHALFQRPNDVAHMPFSYGHISRDPGTHLQFSAPPGTAFGFLGRNEWLWPSGAGWAMPGPWNYYETATKNGWMVWLEGGDDEFLSVRWESDGTNMEWDSHYEPPDHVVIGNRGQELAPPFTFCLRPMFVRNIHGWWDASNFYRQRYEATKPVGYVPQRAFRTDLTEFERRYAVWIDFSCQTTPHSLGDGLPGDMATMVRGLRYSLRAGKDLPIRGTIEAPSYNTDAPGEALNGDLASKVAALLADNVFLTAWVPGVLGPWGWDIRQWLTNERRWWSDFGGLHLLREDRKGYLAGDTEDTLNNYGTRYYRERQYSVISWDPGTLTATLATDPSADGFGPATGCGAVLERGTTTRLAIAAVAAIGSFTIQVTAAFANFAGNPLTPQAGDTVVLLQPYQAGDPGVAVGLMLCPHALAADPTVLANFVLQAGSGQELTYALCGRYYDLTSDVWQRQPTLFTGDRRLNWCYRDHNQIPGAAANNYRPHSRGGGKWLHQARRTLLLAIRDAFRAAQLSAGRRPYYTGAHEYLDQTVHDVIELGFHGLGDQSTWRDVSSVDPSVHKYLCVPSYAAVHSGRAWARSINQEMTSALAATGTGADDPLFRRYTAFFLAANWPYGMTPPTISFFENNAFGIPFIDILNDKTTMPAETRLIVALWRQIVMAEMQDADEFMHQGTMLAPAEIDYALTDTTTGLTGSNFSSATYDVLYDRAAFPRVVACPWLHRDGRVCLIGTNWSDTDAKWAGVLDTEGWGFGPPGSQELRRHPPHRTTGVQDRDTDCFFDTRLAKLVLNRVPRWSVFRVYFHPEPSAKRFVFLNSRRWARRAP